MFIKQKDIIPLELKKQLQKYVYDIVGIIQDVHNDLPQGMPEYIYQEALAIALDNAGIKTEKEYQQLFSYMIGTGFPIGILVNFHSYPKVVIQKFYYDHTDNTITAF